MGGYYVAVGGDLQQLLSADLIGAAIGHLPGQLPIALSQNHDGLAGDGHGVQLVPLVQGLRVVLEVQRGQGLADVLLVVQVALLVQLHGAHGVPRSPLFHELREDAGGVGLLPLRGHAVQDTAAHGAVFPVGDDLLLLDLQVVLRHGEVDYGAVVHVVHVVQGMAAQLRKGGGGLGIIPLFPYDELVLADVELFMGEEVLQHQGPELRDGHLALVHLIGLRLQDGPLHVDVGLGLGADLTKSPDAVVHAAFFRLCHWLTSCLDILETALPEQLLCLVQPLGIRRPHGSPAVEAVQPGVLSAACAVVFQQVDAVWVDCIVL